MYILGIITVDHPLLWVQSRLTQVTLSIWKVTVFQDLEPWVVWTVYPTAFAIQGYCTKEAQKKSTDA